MFVSAVWCDASPSPALQIYLPGFQYTWAPSLGKSGLHLGQGCKAAQLRSCAKAPRQDIYQSSKTLWMTDCSEWHYRSCSIGSSLLLKLWKAAFSVLLRHANWASTRNLHAKQVLKESNSSTCYFQTVVSVWYLSQRCLKRLVYSTPGVTVGSRK